MEISFGHSFYRAGGLVSARLRSSVDYIQSFSSRDAVILAQVNNASFRFLLRSNRLYLVVSRIWCNIYYRRMVIYIGIRDG